MALVGLNNGTVAITKRTSNGSWSTGQTLSGSTGMFGYAIEFDGGWALIAEADTANLVRAYQYVNGAFQPAGTIAAPPGLPAGGTCTGTTWRSAPTANSLLSVPMAMTIQRSRALTMGWSIWWRDQRMELGSPEEH